MESSLSLVLICIRMAMNGNVPQYGMYIKFFYTYVFLFFLSSFSLNEKQKRRVCFNTYKILRKLLTTKFLEYYVCCNSWLALKFIHTL